MYHTQIIIKKSFRIFIFTTHLVFGPFDLGFYIDMHNSTNKRHSSRFLINTWNKSLPSALDFNSITTLFYCTQYHVYQELVFIDQVTFLPSVDFKIVAFWSLEHVWLSFLIHLLVKS